MEIKNLQKTAKELNKILFIQGDEQAINLEAKEKKLVAEIKEAAELLTPDDKLSTDTQKVLVELGITIGGSESDEAEIEDVDDIDDDIDDDTDVDSDDEPEMPEPKKTKMTVTKGGKVETPPTPQELVKKAKGREALVNLINTYTDLKPLRTAHRNYKNDEDLKQVMIAMLNGELKAEEVIGAAKEVGKRNASAEKKEPVAKKEKGVSVASRIDTILQGKGTWEEICSEVAGVCKEAGIKNNYGTEKALRNHIAFRRKTNPDYLKNYKITEKGIA